MLRQEFTIIKLYSFRGGSQRFIRKLDILLEPMYVNHEGTQRPRQDFGFGGNILVGRPCRVSGGRRPTDAREFSKIFVRKLQKFTFYPMFQKRLTKPALLFLTFGQNTIVWETIEKVLKVFTKKIAKNALF